MSLLNAQNSKNQKFGIDKILNPLEAHFDTNSLTAWLSFYYQVHVRGAPEKTEQAKQKDISKWKCNKKSDYCNINSETSPHDDMSQIPHKSSVF